MLGSSLHPSAKMREVGDTQPNSPFSSPLPRPGISQSSWGLTTSTNLKKPSRSGESSSTTSTLSTTATRCTTTSCCSRQGVLRGHRVGWGLGLAGTGQGSSWPLAPSAQSAGGWEGLGKEPRAGFGASCGFHSSSPELAAPARPPLPLHRKCPAHSLLQTLSFPPANLKGHSQ